MRRKQDSPLPDDRGLQNGQCPCGSERSFAACCGRYLLGADRPATAEALMRSRYTAYTLQREDYLLETWHPAMRPEALQLDEEPRPQWLGLKIVAIEAGGTSDSEGLVEFIARYKRGGKATRLHERSYFKRIEGRWLYVGAEVK